MERTPMNRNRGVLILIALFALAGLSAATYVFVAHSLGYELFCPFATGCRLLVVHVVGGADGRVGRARHLRRLWKSEERQPARMMPCPNGPGGATQNNAYERTAGSHLLATAAQRGRSASRGCALRTFRSEGVGDDHSHGVRTPARCAMPGADAAYGRRSRRGYQWSQRYVARPAPASRWDA
jgi:hypothetical protein